MQLYLVEHIQQKLFAKTAFEFAYNIPRMRIESLFANHPPELANRFFDIISLQKGLSKLLIDFSAALLQIFFGLILLSFYHPYFIFFGIFLIAILLLVIRFTGPKGLATSLYESKYKYKMANWLQELARSMKSFKIVGHSNLALDKTDHYVSDYLRSRKSHFNVLATQYFSFVGFKTLITGGLLVMGCILLIGKEINIGQFVASEIIIILIMAAVEKILVKLDTVYDVLTSLEKIDQLRDVPLEKENSLKAEDLKLDIGLSLQVKNLSYKYPGDKQYTLRNLSLSVAPGDKIGIVGLNAAGKTTLINILLGLLHEYEGIVAVNQVSYRDIQRESLLNYIGNDSEETLFDGTIIENIQMGHTNISLHDALQAIEIAGLTEYVQHLPNGLETNLVGGSTWLSHSVSQRLLLARFIAKKPRLLILNDFLSKVDRKQKKKILNHLMSSEFNCTILFISTDPDILEICDQILYMKDGTIVDKAFSDAEDAHILTKGNY
jgi:ABC-type bacteriocin/lantibiotic exporter with double-glycine peptidase domain